MLGPVEPREAAAVVAAVEQFLADTAPAPQPSEPVVSPWQRAALLEGVRAKESFASPWGRAADLGPAPYAGASGLTAADEVVSGYKGSSEHPSPRRAQWP